MDYDELVKRLRVGTDGCLYRDGPDELMGESADAITKLQARVEELEGERDIWNKECDRREDDRIKAEQRTDFARQRAERAEADLAAAQAARSYTCPQHAAEEAKGGACVWCQLAAARGMLKQANEMLAEAIVCGPKLREYMPLRQRIVAALAGEKNDGL